MRTANLFFLILPSLFSVAFCKCCGMYTKCSFGADLSVQQHIKNGIPQHQDYVINNYFDDTCKTIRLSLLWHQFLECKALEPRKFNCTFLIESVWLKIVDKTAIEEDFAPCAHLFTNNVTHLKRKQLHREWNRCIQGL
ncbi:hypothetical protein WA577_000271 [Blastocystis sp. JDR]